MQNRVQLLAAAIASILSPTQNLLLGAFVLIRSLFRKIVGETQSAPFHSERHLRRVLWYLIGGTRGGPSRIEILKALRNRPLNANQLAGAVHLDYKTVEHHLRVLEEHGLVASSEKGAYGAVLFLTPVMEEAWSMVEEIWAKIGRTKISPGEEEASGGRSN